MDNEKGVRIANVRKKLGLTQSQFAEKIGLKFSAISMIELGKAPLTEANIRLICLTFGVREEWLRVGNGEMLNDEALLSERERRLLELFRRLSPQAQQMIIEYAEKLLADERAIRGEPPEASKQAPGGTTQPLEAPQEAKPVPEADTEKGESPGIGPHPKSGETG
jgi:transcriptional regulator with XRE-family HTH domain